MKEIRPYKNLPPGLTGRQTFDAIVNKRISEIMHRASSKEDAILTVVENLVRKKSYQNEYGFIEKDIWEHVLYNILR
jgi:hypothetical protein